MWRLCWAEWASSLLWGVRGVFSLKLKRGDVSAVVGEDGPALDTVLEGPLLSVNTHTHTEQTARMSVYAHTHTKHTHKKHTLNDK